MNHSFQKMLSNKLRVDWFFLIQAQDLQKDANTAFLVLQGTCQGPETDAPNLIPKSLLRWPALFRMGG